MLPNPANFYVNEALFSVSSTDVLFHLRKEEYFRRAEEADLEPGVKAAPKDAMAELCRHVLGQRSWVTLQNPSGRSLIGGRKQHVPDYPAACRCASRCQL